MLALLQAETERILEQRLAEHGTLVEWSTEFTGFEAASDRVRARLVGDDGERLVEARYLIGADGAHSAVRHALGLPFRGTTDPRRGGWSTCAWTGPSPRPSSTCSRDRPPSWA